MPFHHTSSDYITIAYATGIVKKDSAGRGQTHEIQPCHFREIAESILHDSDIGIASGSPPSRG
jgi:hypothetical protein